MAENTKLLKKIPGRLITWKMRIDPDAAARGLPNAGQAALEAGELVGKSFKKFEKSLKK